MSAALFSPPARAASVVAGPMRHQVCVGKGSVNVRNAKLDQVEFKVVNGAQALPVQSWTEEKKTRTIKGEKVTFAQFEFPNQPGKKKKGWIAEHLVSLTAKCASNAKAPAPTAPPVVATEPAGEKYGETVFPTTKRPYESYLDGVRRFGANRSKGRRLHAACDLYRTEGERVRSAIQGKIIRDIYFFYQGTYALEVKTKDGRVIRYGEIKGKRAQNVAGGATLRTGDTVGYVGKVNSGCCEPMLHFEMYQGTKSGSLSQSNGKFSRRSDLMNPTRILQGWESETFGKSYQ